MSQENTISKEQGLSIYQKNIGTQKEEIEKKIQNLEKKLMSLENKETIVNSMISKQNMYLESIDPNHFKAISQARNTLNHQFETLSLIIDMITKFEDMIQKYRKMLIDIENQKFSNTIRASKEEEQEETDVMHALLMLNEKFQKIQNGETENIDESSVVLIEDIQKELQEQGY